MIQSSLTPFTRVGLRKAQGILRLADKYSKERLELACQRAITFDNYEYKALCNILSNELDKIKTQGQDLDATKTPNPNLSKSSYIRPSDEYVSDMEVNYA
jgi:hypothetical protein